MELKLIDFAKVDGNYYRIVTQKTTYGYDNRYRTLAIQCNANGEPILFYADRALEYLTIEEAKQGHEQMVAWYKQRGGDEQCHQKTVAI